MKQTLNFALILSFLLAACSSATATPIIPTETSIPLEPTLTATFTPAPTETPIPPLESLAVTQESVSQFVNAMQNTGINVTAEQILQQGLQIQVIIGADGKQYEIAMANLDPDPNQKGEALEGDYPLMVKTKEGEWVRMTPKHGEQFGIQIGYQFMANDEGAFDKPYKQRGTDTFGNITTINELTPGFINNYGNDGIKKAVELANAGGQTVLISNFFDPRITNDYANDGNPVVVEKRMRERLSYAFSEIKNIDRRPIYIGGPHEIFDYNPNNGEMRLKPSDPLTKVFGADAVGKAISIMIEEAINSGLIEKDYLADSQVRFMIAITQLARDPKFVDFALQEFDKAGIYVANEYNIPVEKVPMGIYIEAHTQAKGKPMSYDHDPQLTESEYIDLFKKFTSRGDVFITETEMQGAGSGAEITAFYGDLIRAGKAAGVKGISIWRGNVSCTETTDPGWCDPKGNIFDQQGNPTLLYYQILAEMIR